MVSGCHSRSACSAVFHMTRALPMLRSEEPGTIPGLGRIAGVSPFELPRWSGAPLPSQTAARTCARDGVGAFTGTPQRHRSGPIIPIADGLPPRSGSPECYPDRHWG